MTLAPNSNLGWGGLYYLSYFVISYHKLKQIMTIILKKGVSYEEVDKQIKATNSEPKLHNFDKYVGVLKLKEDPLTIQKSMRNEWK